MPWVSEILCPKPLFPGAQGHLLVSIVPITGWLLVSMVPMGGWTLVSIVPTAGRLLSSTVLRTGRFEVVLHPDKSTAAEVPK